jgi:hypothetical protein
MALRPPAVSTRDAGAVREVRLAPVLGLIGTFMLCAAAMMAHLSPAQLKPVAMVLWLFGLLVQIAAFAMACSRHRSAPGNRR